MIMNIKFKINRLINLIFINLFVIETILRKIKMSENELRRLRDKLGLSNKELAELMGLSEQTIRNRVVNNCNKKIMNKLELEYLKLLADEHDYFKLKKRK